MAASDIECSKLDLGGHVDHTTSPTGRKALQSPADGLFCSGRQALVYRVLWLSMLGLVFGVTVYATSTVFAAFMAGLALRGWLAGRIGDRSRRPLVLFGCA